jgi:hypothetical protein
VGYAEDLVRYDWLLGAKGRILHAPHPDFPMPTDDPAIAERWRTACNHWIHGSIPGMFSRLELPRCGRCCDVMGYPPGTGSPRNDPAIRSLLGLDG